MVRRSSRDQLEGSEGVPDADGNGGGGGGAGGAGGSGAAGGGGGGSGGATGDIGAAVMLVRSLTEQAPLWAAHVAQLERGVFETPPPTRCLCPVLPARRLGRDGHSVTPHSRQCGGERRPTSESDPTTLTTHHRHSLSFIPFPLPGETLLRRQRHLLAADWTHASNVRGALADYEQLLSRRTLAMETQLPALQQKVNTHMGEGTTSLISRAVFF